MSTRTRALTLTRTHSLRTPLSHALPTSQAPLHAPVCFSAQYLSPKTQKPSQTHPFSLTQPHPHLPHRLSRRQRTHSQNVPRRRAGPRSASRSTASCPAAARTWPRATDARDAPRTRPPRSAATSTVSHIRPGHDGCASRLHACHSRRKANDDGVVLRHYELLIQWKREL